MTKEIKVTPINDGTVIDHLNAGTAHRILGVVNLDGVQVTIAMNVGSKKMGSKDVMFIQGKELSEKELNKIALIGKGASVNIIRNSEINKKFQLGYPKKAEGIIKCINPKCVTNAEKIATKFSITENPLEAQCYYCETRMNETEITESIKK